MLNNPLVAVINRDVRTIADTPLPWDMLSGCRVVVTGAAGFLGGYLTRLLQSLHALGKISQPIRVVAIVRDSARARATLTDLSDNPDFELFQADLNALAVPAIGAVHYVLHAASQASPKFYGVDPVGTILPNTVGTVALLEALRCSDDPRGFLFVSSSEVYGNVDGAASLAEEDYGTVNPATVRACYAEGKRAGETICVSYHQQYALPTFIVRPFHTYGPGLKPDDGRVFADFAFSVVRDVNIIMTSDGSSRRAYCYVTDAIAGIFTVLLKGQPGTPYNVANPAAEMSVLDLAELVVGLLPEKGLAVMRRVPDNNAAYMPSPYNRLIPAVSRLNELGWHARVTPADGFRRMIGAYTETH
mgnify:FL=1